MSPVERVDAYQRRHRWLGFPLAVLYKFFDDQGNYLAAIITYYGLLSVFPLLLLFATVLGFVLHGNPGAQRQLLHSVLAQFPLVGAQLQRSIHSLSGSGLGLSLGIAGALYGGLGVIQGAQNAFNRIYAVPRHDRPDPIHARGRSLALLPVLGVGVLLTTVLSGLTTSATAYLGTGARAGGTALSIVLNICVFVVAFRLLTARDLSIRDVIVGAALAGISWQVLQSVGTYVLGHSLEEASNVAGTFRILFGLLAWIYVEAVITVLCAEINTVLTRKLWPRALLALVSDTEALTDSDRESYESYSRIERYKSFQEITVRFNAKSKAVAPGTPTPPQPVQEARPPPWPPGTPGARIDGVEAMGGIACGWCHAQSPVSATTCRRCGAPLDVTKVVTDSGWRMAPRLRDLTEVRLGDSTCQLEGTVVPVADVELGAGKTAFFEHHVMLWKDEAVEMSVMDAPGGAKRMLAGMPFVLSVARGPGRVSCSRDAPGELVVLPVDPGAEIDVREHGMVLATGTVTYTFERLPGLKATLAAGSGMYLDRFGCADDPGLLILHGFGNVLQRELGAGESLDVEPGGFLYKDSSVSIEVVTHKLRPDEGGAKQAARGLASRGLAGIKAARELKKQGIGGLMSGEVLQTASGVLTGAGITVMRLSGPGRVGIQSMYRDYETA